jgi:glycosyltransferase involved in cell wall biosynthesis
MASFNGEKFILKQINSILLQLSKDDELIIIDDCSKDDTFKIISEINNKRIKIIKNERNLGIVQSFSRSMLLAKGDFIFLSDQDDIWFPNRLKFMLSEIKAHNACLVTSNFRWIDENDNEIYPIFKGLIKNNSNKHYKNILNIFQGHNNYLGCAMVFKKSLLQIAVPIPNIVEAHDLWIAKIGNLLHSNLHLNESTFFKRKHSNNSSLLFSKRKLYKKIYSRFVFFISILIILLRISKKRKSTYRTTGKW